MHLPQKSRNGEREAYNGIAEYPPEMREDPHKIAAQYCPLHFHRVDKGQSVRDFHKRAADQMDVKPHTGEPSRQIREQRAA